MAMLNRTLLAAGMSWGFSVTLGLLFAACASGRFSLRTLLLPGVVRVALITSTVLAVLVTPIAVWAVKTGTKNLCIYGPIVWIALGTYILLVIPRTGPHGSYGLLLLAVVSLVILRLIPASTGARGHVGKSH